MQSGLRRLPAEWDGNIYYARHVARQRDTCRTFCVNRVGSLKVINSLLFTRCERISLKFYSTRSLDPVQGYGNVVVAEWRASSEAKPGVFISSRMPLPSLLLLVSNKPIILCSQSVPIDAREDLH